MFSFIKNCLLTFNYPLAHTMSDEELGEIFKTSNRCFLISWMMKLLDSAYEETLENDKDSLGNFVYELGFCTQKEKLPFMAGELPESQQVKIIWEMFNFITDVKKYDANNTKNKTVTNEDILALDNTNLNLFPMYGDIRLARTEKSLQLSAIVKEINETTLLDREEKDSDQDYLMVHRFRDDIELFLKKLKEELPNIKFVLENVCKKKNTKSKEVINLQMNSAEILKKCRESLNIISQFIKDIHTIQNFMKNYMESTEQAGERNVAHSEMVNVLFQEVLSTIRYIKFL